jgi:hypothetical protein
MLISTLQKKKRRSYCKEDNHLEEHLLLPKEWIKEMKKV